MVMPGWMNSLLTKIILSFLFQAPLFSALLLIFWWFDGPFHWLLSGLKISGCSLFLETTLFIAVCLTNSIWVIPKKLDLARYKFIKVNFGVTLLMCTLKSNWLILCEICKQEHFTIIYWNCVCGGLNFFLIHIDIESRNPIAPLDEGKFCFLIHKEPKKSSPEDPRATRHRTSLTRR